MFFSPIDSLNGIKGDEELREALFEANIKDLRQLLGHFLRLGEYGFRRWLQTDLCPRVKVASLNACCAWLRNWIKQHLWVRGDRSWSSKQKL